jgi:hypothetical protein
VSHVGAAEHQKSGEQSGKRDKADNDYRTRHLNYPLFCVVIFRKPV